MRHFLLQFAAASALTAFSIATAHAHAGLEQERAAPGSYKAVMNIPHGCDGQPTNTVRIDIPEGYIGVKPMPKPGWSLAIESGDYAKPYKLHGGEVTSGPKAVTWSGGALDDAYFDQFTLSGTLAGVEEGQTLLFKTTQVCANGEVTWSEVPAPGQNAHSLEFPAPSLTILAAAEDHHGGHGGGDAGAVTAGDLEVASPWARAMLPNQPTGGGYFTVTNKGSEADRLTGASSPAAGKVEIHTMEVTNDVMTMRRVEGGLEIPADTAVELKPGGLHLMFMDVPEAFKEGGTVPVTLEFAKAGKVEVVLPVRAASGGGGAHEH